MPPPSLHKIDFLPFCLPHARSGHRQPAARPARPNQWKSGRYCSIRRGPGAFGGFQEASSRLRSPAASPRRARRCAGPRRRPLAGAGRSPPRERTASPSPLALALPAAVRGPGAAIGPLPGSPRPPRTCPSGRSACQGRRPPDAPDPAAGTSSGRPHPLPRAGSFSSTGVRGRRGRPRPPRSPSSGCWGVAGGGGVRLVALSSPPRAPAFIL